MSQVLDKIILRCMNGQKDRDPSRLVHYEGETREMLLEDHFMPTRDPIASDVHTSMYTPIEKLKVIGGLTDLKSPIFYANMLMQWAMVQAASKNIGRPFYAFDRLQGGFVWEWVDHGLRQYTEEGKEYFAYGGDFGETPHDGNFVIDGLFRPNREPSPALAEFKKVIEPVVTSHFNIKKRPYRYKIDLTFPIYRRYNVSGLSK